MRFFCYILGMRCESPKGKMQLHCVSSKPSFDYPLHRAPFLSTRYNPRKPDPLASFPSSTLPTRNSGFSNRVSCTRISVRIRPWTRISSAFREWLLSSFSIGQWPRFSRVLTIFLLAFILEGEARGSPLPSPIYPCEDVRSYYASAEDNKGKELRKALHATVAGHRSLSYKEVWDALKILDASEVNDPEASLGIVEIYSLRVVPKQLAGKPDGWNREHLWPRSYGLTGGPSLTDLNNIRPADVNVNSSRGNKYFGECCIDSVDCTKPANKEAAADTETDKEKWAPPKQVRGDVARALMYMAVRYRIQEPGFPVLKLSDSPSTKTREMGLLSTLLKWNEIDPPSREEKLRNDRVCSIYQHNRNPFVDHPEYAKLIWKQGNPSCPSLQLPLKAWSNKSRYNRGADKSGANPPNSTF